jgi:hypothetical protein
LKRLILSVPNRLLVHSLDHKTRTANCEMGNVTKPDWHDVERPIRNVSMQAYYRCMHEARRRQTDTDECDAWWVKDKTARALFATRDEGGQRMMPSGAIEFDRAARRVAQREGLPENAYSVRE